MPAPNHYEVLGLTPSASTGEVERRYEELWKLYGSDGAHAPMMRLIQEARRVLTSPALRDIYDSGLQAAPAPPAPEVVTRSAPPAASVPPVPPVPEPIVSEEITVPVPPPPGMEVTQAVPRPELERTTAVKPPPAPPAPDSLPDEKRLAKELAKRGVASDEVERLLSLGRNEPAPVKKGARPLPSAPVIPPSEAYVPKPTITLPPFRTSTVDERQRAERLLTNANIARRRGVFKEAEKECRAALDLIPGDAAALELFGDIMQAVGRVDDALYAYQRATEADAGRKTAEKKYAELMLLQNHEIEMLRVESIPRNASLAVLLSAVFPGVGQIYNGDTLKGLVIMVIVGSCIYLLGWSPYGFHKGLKSLSAPLVFFTAVALLTYAYAVVDANVSARRGKLRSGWDV